MPFRRACPQNSSLQACSRNYNLFLDHDQDFCNFFKRYYEIGISLEPVIEKISGRSYLIGIFKGEKGDITFDHLGGFYVPRYTTESPDEPYPFDCSQMAALVEYYLERSGIRAKIAVTGNLTTRNGETVASLSDVQWQNNFTHAFVVVDIPGGPYYLDTARPDFNRSENLILIGPEDAEYNKPYYDYEQLYSSIYELIRASHQDPAGRLLEEFAWWGSPVFLPEKKKSLKSSI